MKKSILYLLAFILPVIAMAQSPSMFSYQAVVRNSSNQPVVNQTVGMRISILQGKPFGNAVYQEHHSPNTNENGLVSIIIGAGDQPVTGIFDSINWADGPYYLLTEIDPAGGSNYTITGSTQLLSVPYALYAKNGVPQKGNDPAGLNQPLYNCTTGPQWGPCPPIIRMDSLGGENLNNLYALFGTIVSHGTFPINLVEAIFYEKNNTTNLYTVYGFVTVDNLIRVPLSEMFKLRLLKSNTEYEVKVIARSRNTFKNEDMTSESTISFTTDLKIPFDTVMVNGRPADVAYVNRKGEVFSFGWLAFGVDYGCSNANLDSKLESNPSGLENTAMIVAACSTSAAKIANDYVSQDNFRDWYLPSISELNALIAGMGITSFAVGNSYPEVYTIGSSNVVNKFGEIYYAGIQLVNDGSSVSQEAYLEDLNEGFAADINNSTYKISETLMDLLGIRKVKQL